MGRDRDERYNVHLRYLITASTVKPSIVVSHRLPLAEAPMLPRYGRREDGYLKVILDLAAASQL